MESILPNTQQANTENLNEDATKKTTGENNDLHEGKTIKSQDTQKGLDQSDNEVTELLGSVTTHNCPGTRFSARVIQKMKQDQTRPATPPPNDREQKKEEKTLQKTPSNMRANKPIWTNLERNYFFDALNEFGKDFEGIGNYINLKLKRKNATDKTIQQVRQHYYQTYHKICKYVKFSDEVKKPVQELYALINYGEMRRKLQFVTDKHFMKLKNLIYQGHITVRCKGKNIRVKTPSCKALRRINQLDDTLEDIRLPSKIEVILTPANMETFGRLQTIAQNPRVRCMVPLHRKLVNFIKTFQHRWRSPEARLIEEEAKIFPSDAPNEKVEEKLDITHSIVHDTQLCFVPKSGVTIHRPLLSITEHLRSGNICLNVYEERLGVKVRSQNLCQDRANAKRQRTDSGSEKRSPEAKKSKQLIEKSNNVIADSEIFETVKENTNVQIKSESSSDELNDEIVTELLSDTDNHAQKDDNITITTNTTNENQILNPIQQNRTKRGGGGSTGIGKSMRANQMANTFKPLLNNEALRRIYQGWTISNAADITIGDLYVVMGQDSRLEFEYYWTDQLLKDKSTVGVSTEVNTIPPITSSTANDNKFTIAGTSTTSSLFMQKQTGMPYNPTDCDEPELLTSISSSSVSNKLKHLLLIANLSERIRKRQCSCGHICDRGIAKTRYERDLLAKNSIHGRLSMINQDSKSTNNRTTDSSVFRQPYLPPRKPLHSMDPVKQLAALSGFKTARHILVQRLLLPGGASQAVEVDGDKFQISDTYQQNTSAIKPINTITTNNCDNTNVISTTPKEETPPLCSFAGTVDALKSSTESNFNINSLALNETPAIRNTPSSTDSAIDDCSSITSIFGGMSPMHLLRETTSNSRWLEENLNDFSLTSLLGHLDEINNSNRDIVDPSNLSVISESSVDYMHKFQEISAFMQKQEKD